MNQLFSLGLQTLAASEGVTGREALYTYIVLTVLAIFLFLFAAKKGMNAKVFKNFWTQSFEQLYLFIQQMCIGIIGPHGRRYVPMVLTFWLVIFFGNLLALFFPYSPTADLSFNLGMALISIGYVQWEGIKANGVFGHFKHFAGPKLGGPLIIISVMIFFIELVSEMMKNVSLSLRLYGNIHGGHEAVVAMNELGYHIGGTPITIPFGFFLIPIKMLTVVVQAMIFTLLTCVYISLVTHHEDDGHDHDDHDDHGHDDPAPKAMEHAHA